MNYTPATQSKFKTPLTANDLKPVMVDHSTANIQMTNNRKIDPDILNRIRELAPISGEDMGGNGGGTSASLSTQPKNPFRAKTGLMFRDILGRADNNRSCSSCGSVKK